MPTGLHGYLPPIPSCIVMENMVDVPVFWPRYPEGDSSLIWTTPDCGGCELNGGTCGSKMLGVLILDALIYQAMTVYVSLVMVALFSFQSHMAVTFEMDMYNASNLEDTEQEQGEHLGDIDVPMP
ncbi:hypothetical protein GH714_011068 [Hevea brasiliensis]|uniref:Uncharacterized protein n=1 Tax=Hevea brasiliensis TaxID=3981 RepID=A0A6A6MIA8_HEVBR|nr:hypothetical protein GH714_011068 [Hevea brasiliensis]